MGASFFQTKFMLPCWQVIIAMNTELPQVPLSAEELAVRQKNVRKVILLRGCLLGLIFAAWWVLFAPDSVVDPEYKTILGVLAGLLATGSYFFSLRATLFPPR